MGKLVANISKLGKPCQVSDRTWYITIYNCDGSVLKYKGKKYLCIPAKNGHLEIKDLPCGKYKISAVWSYWISDGIYSGNHFTDSALFCIDCDETTCITLFNPEIHRCGVIYNEAVKDFTAQLVKKYPNDTRIPQLFQNLLGANQDFLNLINELEPQEAPLFEFQNPAEFERILKERAEDDDGGYYSGSDSDC